MRGLGKLTLYNLKLYLREPMASFFTLLYAPMMLVLFGSIYGNEPSPMFGGRGTVDVSVPAYIALVIVTVGLISIPIGTASRRETGVLRRFRATPLRPLTYLVADVAVYFAVTALGVLLLVATGKIGFHLKFQGNVLSVALGFILGMSAFTALGYVVAGLSPSGRAAQAIGMFVAFPFMFLSGATVPLEALPAGVRSVAQFIPLTHVVTLLRGLWTGGSWGSFGKEIAVLVGVLVVGVAVSAQTFRWE